MDSGASQSKFGLLMALILMNVSAIGLLLFSESVPSTQNRKYSGEENEVRAEDVTTKNSIIPAKKQSTNLSYRPNTSTDKTPAPQMSNFVRASTESLSETSFYGAGYEWGGRLIENIENNFGSVLQSTQDRTSTIMCNFNSTMVPAIEKLNSTVAQAIRLERQLDSYTSNMIDALNAAVCPTVNRVNKIISTISQKWEGRSSFCSDGLPLLDPLMQDYLNLLSQSESASREKRPAYIVAIGKRWLTRKNKLEKMQKKKTKKKQVVTKVVKMDAEVGVPQAASFSGSSALPVPTVEWDPYQVHRSMGGHEEVFAGKQDFEFENILMVPSTLLSHGPAALVKDEKELIEWKDYLASNSSENDEQLDMPFKVLSVEKIHPAVPLDIEDSPQLEEQSSLFACGCFGNTVLYRPSLVVATRSTHGELSMVDYKEAFRVRPDDPEINVVASLCMMILKIFETWSDTQLSQSSFSLDAISRMSSKLLICTEESHLRVKSLSALTHVAATKTDVEWSQSDRSASLRKTGVDRSQSDQSASLCNLDQERVVTEEERHFKSLEMAVIPNKLGQNILPNEIQSQMPSFTTNYPLLSYPLFLLEQAKENADLVTETSPSRHDPPPLRSLITEGVHSAACNEIIRIKSKESLLKASSELKSWNDSKSFSDSNSVANTGNNNLECLDASSSDTFYSETSGQSSDEAFCECPSRNSVGSSGGVGLMDQKVVHLSKIQEEEFTESRKKRLPDFSEVDGIMPSEEHRNVFVPWAIEMRPGEEGSEYLNSMGTFESDESLGESATTISTAIHTDEDSCYSLARVSTEISSQPIEAHHKNRKWSKNIFKRLITKKRKKHQDSSEPGTMSEPKLKRGKRTFSGLLTSRGKK